MAMTALVGEGLDQFDLTRGEVAGLAGKACVQLFQARRIG
jgi:hypothetical protein